MNHPEGDVYECGCLRGSLPASGGGLARGGMGRRALLGGFGALAAGAATHGVRPARAAESEYEAMLLSCIDPRFVDPVHGYLAGRGLGGKYSQFNIAGAAIGVVAPKFHTWHEAFWDNFAASLTLHRITAVIAIDHRDCGAARIAYGADSIGTPERETKLHREVFERFRRDLAKRHPDLSAETWLMSLGGDAEKIG